MTTSQDNEKTKYLEGVSIEPPGPSICAFCANQLGVARRPSHVQRRFLQSSRPASKPPAAAAVLREEPALSSWENDPHAVPAPVWGFRRLSGLGSASTPMPGSNRWSGHAFGTSELELTEEEKQVRDLVNQNAKMQQRRPIKVYPQPGPESSRAGRPTFPENGRISPARQKLMELRNQQAQVNGLQTNYHTPNDNHRDSDTNILRKESSLETLGKGHRPADLASNWGQLRRRQNDSEHQSIPSYTDRFSEGRARREEESKSARYTPLIRRSFSLPLESLRIRKAISTLEDSTANQPKAQAARSPTKGEWQPRTFGLQGGRKQSLFNSPSEKPVHPNARTLQQGFNESPTNSTRESMGADGIQKTEIYRPQELESEREVRHGRRAARYTAEEVSRTEITEEAPRGRARDKMRRRQQFVQEYDEDEEHAAVARAELKRQRKREKAAKKAAASVPILLPEYISVANLAAALKVRVEDFMEKMEELGFEETSYDHVLNSENAGLIALEYNFEPIIDRGQSEDLKARPAAINPSELPPRPPVVTIMGHVDHGKTTLLDWLRKSSVAATEHGGITQHIGAFSVPMPSGKTITFLDTPGHAAFLNMRQRGANVTDIVILVVAADDSVKPQTIEAINHAKSAKVPIIVAINKVDKEEANIDRVKQDLARHGIEIEDFGGDTQVVCVSGKTGQGMEELEDAVVTLSEILDMRAEQVGQAEGWVLEASIKSMGKVATVLVRRGTMRPGDFIVAGKTWARIRCLRNEAGMDVTEAGPGMPVEIDGWKEQPEAGDEVLQTPNESKAKSVVEYRLENLERNKMAEDMEAINEARKSEQEKREREKSEIETLMPGFDTGSLPAGAALDQARHPKQVNFIIKGDVSGSVEAIVNSISSIGSAEVQPHIIRFGVGQLSEFDVEHAAAARGYLINFNTPVDPNISRLAQAEKVKIIDQNVIYRLVDEIKATLSEYLTPMVTQRVLGEADVAQVFQITIKGRLSKAIAGCKVKNGMISKNAKVRVSRDGEKIFDGKLASLKNVKKDVTEMRKGTECGIGFEGWNGFKVGDQIQCYETKEEKRYL